MTVFLLVGRFSVAVTARVTGTGPQSNVITPPWLTADCRASNEQLAWLPVPTTVVGLEVSAGCPEAGTPALHLPSGFPAAVSPAAPAAPTAPAVPTSPAVPVTAVPEPD